MLNCILPDTSLKTLKFPPGLICQTSSSCVIRYGIFLWFDLQLDALNSCVFTHNTFIKLLYMFQALINVLYVNKQEFSASSWRSNQGYTTMHGQPTIKMASFT